MAELFAWTAPASVVGAVADHTWVTTYDSRTRAYPDIGAVTAAGEDYWYCWGIFRARGGAPGNPTGFLGSQAGDRNFAACLVAPNLDSVRHPPARGTIFRYGLDGVCHQLSNQVLYATGGSGGAPLTVSRARGYWASVAVYGSYGRQNAAWQHRVRTCSARIGGGGGARAAGDGAMEAHDEFARRAGELLGDDPEALASLLQLRAETHRHFADRPFGRSGASADLLNAFNDMFFDEAARIVGPARFERLFGFRPGEQPALVDPAILDAQRLSEEGEGAA
ncbi:MAG TPA: hypothetical protein VHM92_11755 [Allosphingosinicella sp.]|nr:hypothetical protein [Allosphingosinicella sp.]